eukprot:12235744-Ditylum_brightwellii.AAC.1
MDGYDAHNRDSVILCSRKASEQLPQQAKVFGKDQYPKTITEINNVLSNHRFNNNRCQQDKNRHSDRYESTSTEDTDEPPTLSFTQMKGRCYFCGKLGHKSLQCNKKNTITREYWAIKKSQ